jgi:alkanesulfonate monooxygenase SsuD/methylene tetrahydromethanopterin reductase-like flavin-dependent oxidoreductase (luciferase family)
LSKRLEFGAVGHAFAGGVADLSTNWPFYGRIDWEAERNFALEVEALGFGSIWLPDHLSVGPGGTTLESWTTVTTYLIITKRLRAGPFALSNNFRYPSMVAKMVSTLDLISGGRVNLAIGAGWDESEYSQ